MRHAGQREPTTTALEVEGRIRHPSDGGAWEYSVVLAIRDGDGKEINRQVIGVGALLVGAGVAGLMRRTYPHDRIGGCNAVTLLRAGLVCALLMPLAAGDAAGWGVAGVAAEHRYVVIQSRWPRAGYGREVTHGCHVTRQFRPDRFGCY